MELYVISYCRLFNQHGRILFPQFVFYVQNKTHLEEVHAVPADLCSEYFSDDRKHLYFSWCARAKWNGFTSTRLCYCHSIYFLHFKKDTKKRPLPLRGSAKFHHIYTSFNYNSSLFLFTIHTKKSSLSATGTTLSTGTASAFSLATLSPGASARAIPVGVFAPSAPIDLYWLLKRVVLLNSLLFRVDDNHDDEKPNQRAWTTCSTGDWTACTKRPASP